MVLIYIDPFFASNMQPNGNHRESMHEGEALFANDQSDASWNKNLAAYQPEPKLDDANYIAVYHGKLDWMF